MRPRLVFVHGIGAPRDERKELAVWTAALAMGAQRAGHSHFAADLLESGPSGPVDSRFAYYGDLFQAPGAQGSAGKPSEQDAEIVIALLSDLVEEQLAVVSDEESRLILIDAEEQLRPAGTPQGTGNLVRIANGAIATLLEWRPLRRAGQWATGKILIREMSQVSRYLNRGELDKGSTIDQRIRTRVRDILGHGPVIVVAHSLGTVVSLEALHEFTGDAALFVTLGSPLGTPTVVRPKLVPQPPATPESVRRWLNFWDRDDIIVSRPGLEKVFAANSRAVLPRSSRIDSDGLWVHTATKYLAQPAVAGPIAEAMTMATPPTTPPTTTPTDLGGTA